MNTVYFDIGDTLRYSRSNRTLTGIQRFVTQAIIHLVNKYGLDRIKLIAYHPRKKRLVCYDASYFLGEFDFDRNCFLHHFGVRRQFLIPPKLVSYVDDKYGSRWKDLISAGLLLKNLLSGGRTFRKNGIAITWPEKPAAPVDADIQLKPGDIIFVGGAPWGALPFYTELQRLRQSRGVHVCHYIHDLIPIVAPQYCVSKLSKKFGNWLTMMVDQSDYLLTNSVASAKDLHQWLADKGVLIDVGVVRLAHQFADKSREYIDLGRVSNRVRNEARLPYALCVGTLDARKNIWTLANVWMEVHARLGVATPRLIFAGKSGGMKEDFDAFIKATGSLYGYIRIIDGPSDDELVYLYRNCLFSIYPSYIEGWGLPIGECLWFGRPVICSNTSSMPEVGGDLADYVDPTRPETILQAVLRMIEDVDYRERRAAQISRAHLRSWTDFAEDLWRELSKISSANVFSGANPMNIPCYSQKDCDAANA